MVVRGVLLRPAIAIAPVVSFGVSHVVDHFERMTNANGLTFQEQQDPELLLQKLKERAEELAILPLEIIIHYP